MRPLVVLLVVLASARAFADPKSEARKHVDKAMKAHGAGKFDEALTELTLAYSLDPQPNLLFAIGQVHIKLGHCPEAIDFYQRFLSTKPPAGPAGEARQAVEACKKNAVPEPATLPPPEPPKVEPPKVEPNVEPPKPPPPPPPPPAPHGKRAFYTDVLGDVLVGAGVVAGVAGVIEYAGARSDLDSADKQTTYDAHQKLVDDANSKRTISIVLGAGGAVLVVGGVVRYLVHDRGETDRGVAVVPTRDGGMITWAGRF